MNYLTTRECAHVLAMKPRQLENARWSYVDGATPEYERKLNRIAYEREAVAAWIKAQLDRAQKLHDLRMQRLEEAFSEGKAA